VILMVAAAISLSLGMATEVLYDILIYLVSFVYVFIFFCIFTVRMAQSNSTYCYFGFILLST
jgi:hypothetical protein